MCVWTYQAETSFKQTQDATGLTWGGGGGGHFEVCVSNSCWKLRCIWYLFWDLVDCSSKFKKAKVSRKTLVLTQRPRNRSYNDWSPSKKNKKRRGDVKFWNFSSLKKAFAKRLCTWTQLLSSYPLGKKFLWPLAFALLGELCAREIVKFGQFWGFF